MKIYRKIQTHQSKDTEIDYGNMYLWIQDIKINMAVIYQDMGRYERFDTGEQVKSKDLVPYVLWNESWSECLQILNNQKPQVKVLWYNNYWIVIHWLKWMFYRWVRSNLFKSSISKFVKKIGRRYFIPRDVFKDMLYNSKEFIPVYKQQLWKRARVIVNKRKYYPAGFTDLFSKAIHYCKKTRDLAEKASTSEQLELLGKITDQVWNYYLEFLMAVENNREDLKRKLFGRYSEWSTTVRDLIDWCIHY